MATIPHNRFNRYDQAFAGLGLFRSQTPPELSRRAALWCNMSGPVLHLEM